MRKILAAGGFRDRPNWAFADLAAWMVGRHCGGLREAASTGLGRSATSGERLQNRTVSSTVVPDQDRTEISTVVTAGR